MKTILGLVVLVLLAVGGYIGWTFYRSQQMAASPVKEIASEKIERVGDTWHVAFTSRFDAPVDKVWDAFGQPERVHEYAPENVLKSELVKNENNVKVVDIIGRLDKRVAGVRANQVFGVFSVDNQLTVPNQVAR